MDNRRACELDSVEGAITSHPATSRTSKLTTISRTNRSAHTQCPQSMQLDPSNSQQSDVLRNCFAV